MSWTLIEAEIKYSCGRLIGNVWHQLAGVCTCPTLLPFHLKFVCLVHNATHCLLHAFSRKTVNAFSANYPDYLSNILRGFESFDFGFSFASEIGSPSMDTNSALGTRLS